MSELKVFENSEFGNVRTVNVDEKIYFVASDVAKCLGYANPHKAIKDHCKGVNETLVPSNGGNQLMNVIPEGDIYRLIVKSQLPSAEKFEAWVFDEVLPSIRKHGMYATEVTVEKMLNDPDFAIDLLTRLKEERKARIEAEQTNAILMHVNKTYTSTEIAKELNMKSAMALNKALADKKVQYKQNDTWVLYSKYADLGYTEIKQKVLDSGRTVYDRHWTQRGRKFILELFGAEVTE